jgi:hypothetical protein
VNAEDGFGCKKSGLLGAETEKIELFVMVFSPCLSTLISSFNCVPPGKVFIFNTNKMSETSIACKMDITENA